MRLQTIKASALYICLILFSEGASPKFWLKIWKLSGAHDHSHGHRLLKLLISFGKTEFKTLIGNVLDRQQAIIEQFSFECRKVIGFALSTRCDWLKRFAPPFHPIRSKTKANCDALARFSRALRQPHVITSSFDWFNVLSVSYVIGQSNYFGFGFTTLKRKPL